MQTLDRNPAALWVESHVPPKATSALRNRTMRRARQGPRAWCPATTQEVAAVAVAPSRVPIVPQGGNTACRWLHPRHHGREVVPQPPA